jgi:K+-sensing histidine kinase KdpD
MTDRKITGNTLSEVTNNEHAIINGTPAKKVALISPDGSLAAVNPLCLKPYNYMERSVDNATETWTFKSGGASGITTNTVVIVYTDASLATILTVTKT